MITCLGKMENIEPQKCKDPVLPLACPCSVPINRSCSWIPFKLMKSILEKQRKGIMHGYSLGSLMNPELLCSFFETPHLLPLQCSGTK